VTLVPSAAGAWPSERQLDLLKAAVLGREQAAEAWRVFLSRSDIQSLDASSTRLLPAVDFNLRRHGIENPHAAVMAGLRRHALFRNQWLLGAAAEVIRVLSERSIRTLMLKGAAVCCIDAPAVSVRLMNDVDVLVPRASAHRAVDALLEAGFRSHAERPHDLIDVRHSTPFSRDHAEIDLHWDVLGESRALDDAWAFENARSLEVQGVRTLALGVAEQLFHSIAHGLRYSETAAAWWPLDAIFVLNKTPIDFARVVELAQKHQLNRALYDGLRYLETHFLVRVDAEALARLRLASSSLSERIETFLRSRRVEPLGELPMHLLHHRRMSAGRPLVERLQTLPRHLSRIWGLKSARDLPRALSRKAFQRVRSLVGSNSLRRRT
jgi:hypothetical protein